MVGARVMIGVITQEYARRADFYDYYESLKLNLPKDTFRILCHDRSPAHGRNLIIDAALENNCTHILFIDDDMAYKPDALNQLLSHDKDIVTGLYLSRQYPHQPLIFEYLDEEKGGLFVYLEDDLPRLKKIEAAGLGFCLVKTDVFRKMERPWIRLGELNSEEWCDDIGFFVRVKKAGFEVYCDTECRVGHMGTMILWPNRDEKGVWYTGYDTGNNVKGMVNTPQINPLSKVVMQ